jgi:hypothetical protein
MEGQDYSVVPHVTCADTRVPAYIGVTCRRVSALKCTTQPSACVYPVWTYYNCVFTVFFLVLTPQFCENKINILQRLLAARVQQTSIAFWCREALDTVTITGAKFKVTSKLLNSDNIL